MRGGLYAGLLLFSVTAGAANETSFGIGRDVRVELTDRISVYEAWNSQSPVLVSSGDAVAMLYVLDAEAAPSKAGRQLLAIVLVGQTGTGIEPVAFRISAPATRTVRLLPGPKERTGYFEVIVGDDQALRLDVQENGRVTLAGHELGTVR